MFKSIYIKLGATVMAAGLTTGCQSKFFQNALGGNPNSFYEMEDQTGAPDDITPPTGGDGSGPGGTDPGGSGPGGTDPGGSGPGGTDPGGSGPGGTDPGGTGPGGTDPGGSGPGTDDPVDPVALDPIADTTLRYGARNTNEGGNVLIHVGEDSNHGLVLFDAGNRNLANIQSARLVMTVSVRSYGVNSGNNSNWPNKNNVKDYVFAHRLLTRDIVEGNGRLRGLENINQRNPGEAMKMKDFYQMLFGTSLAESRGTGAGVTVSCKADSDVSNSAKDCGANQEPSFVFDPNLPDFGATAKAMHHNHMAEGDKVIFDVTADVKAGFTGWILKDAGGGQVRYYSKEGALYHNDNSIAPKLILE